MEIFYFTLAAVLLPHFPSFASSPASKPLHWQATGTPQLAGQELTQDS